MFQKQFGLTISAGISNLFFRSGGKATLPRKARNFDFISELKVKVMPWFSTEKVAFLQLRNSLSRPARMEASKFPRVAVLTENPPSYHKAWWYSRNKMILRITIGKKIPHIEKKIVLVAYLELSNSHTQNVRRERCCFIVNKRTAIKYWKPWSSHP